MFKMSDLSTALSSTGKSYMFSFKGTSPVCYLKKIELESYIDFFSINKEITIIMIVM